MAQVGRDLKRSANFCGRREPRCPYVTHPENLQGWGFHHIPGEVVPVMDCSYCKKNKIFLHQGKTSPCATCPITLCLLHVALSSLSTWMSWWDPLEFSPEWKDVARCLSSQGSFSSLLDPLWSNCIFWVMGLEQDTALHMQPDKRWVEQDDRIPVRVSNARAEPAQNPACLCCWSSALLAHGQQAHQAPFSKAAPQDFHTGPSPYLYSLVMALVCHWFYIVGQLQVKLFAT